MNKFKIMLLSTAIVLIAASSGILHYKNVQANAITESFKTSLLNKNYEEAAVIKDKATKDIFIEKVYGFSETTRKLTQNEYNSLKNDYLNDKINYDDLNLSIKQLEALNTFIFSTEEKDSIKNIEILREKYRTAEDLCTKGEYTSSSNILREIENKLDESYKIKARELKELIAKKIKDSLTSDIEGYVIKSDYDGALKLLNDKKNLIPIELYNEKFKEINDFKDRKLKEEELKRKAAEEKKRKATEEKKKREEALLAAYLTEYTPNPDKEYVVQNFSSRTKFLVWVDIPSQTTNIFVGSKGDWKIIKSFISSTGKSGTDTPSGTFTTKDKGSWFFSEKYQEGGKYWVRIFGNYLFHSLPMNRNQQVVDPTLGTPASHGCIRLSLEDIRWFFNNISRGTTVYIK